VDNLLIHHDSDRAIQDCVIAGFRGGLFAGTHPKWFPNAYVCLVSEYMDCGSVSSFMEKQLLNLEGVCAVTRQVASALVFMHQKELNHNDLKPVNILLKRSSHGDVLNVKLADLGKAERSGDHRRDRELLGYTMWCMVLGRDSSSCPSKEDRPAAMSELMKASMLGRKATTRGTTLIEAIVGLWNEQQEIPVVACNAEFEGCEVREPEALEMKRQLTARAHFEITKRATDLFDRFKQSGHNVHLAREGLSDTSAIQSALATLDEGSITVRDTRDR